MKNPMDALTEFGSSRSVADWPAELRTQLRSMKVTTEASGYKIYVTRAYDFSPLTPRE